MLLRTRLVCRAATTLSIVTVLLACRSQPSKNANYRSTVKGRSLTLRTFVRTGVPDLFVAQMIGHSSPSILQTYSKAIDEYRRDAIRKLEQMRAAYIEQSAADSNAE